MIMRAYQWIILAGLGIAVATAAVAANPPGIRPPRPSSNRARGAASAPASSLTNNFPKTDFRHYQVIGEKNVFNQNRTGRRRAADGGRAERTAKTEYFTLVGTMSYEKAIYAFFDGSGPTFKKSLKAGESISGCKVTAVGDDRVVILADGKPLELKVGNQLRRQDEGEWKVLSGSARVEVSASATNATASAESSGAAESVENDVLKRLLMKREQENSK